MVRRYDPRGKLGDSPQGGGSEQRLLLIERRLALLEQKAPSPEPYRSNFLAREGELHIVDAPSTGLRVALPAPNTRNRGAVVRLVLRTINPVTVSSVSGLVNTQDVVRFARVGSYEAVSDGATGWWIQSLDGPMARDLYLKDYFISGTTTSGSIGQLGWNLNGVGTPVYTRGGGGLPNVTLGVITTSAATNDRSSLTLGATEAGVIIRPGRTQLVQAAVNFTSTLTSKRVFFGFAETFATAPASVSNSVGFLYDSSVGANYLTIHRQGSAGSATDSGIPVPSNTDQLLTICLNAGGDTWRLLVGSVVAATFPNTTINVTNLPCNIGFRVETLTTAARSLNVGYFGMRAVGLQGVLDDDPFLAS